MGLNHNLPHVRPTLYRLAQHARSTLRCKMTLIAGKLALLYQVPCTQEPPIWDLGGAAVVAATYSFRILLLLGCPSVAMMTLAHLFWTCGWLMKSNTFLDCAVTHWAYVLLPSETLLGEEDNCSIFNGFFWLDIYGQFQVMLLPLRIETICLFFPLVTFSQAWLLRLLSLWSI